MKVTVDLQPRWKGNPSQVEQTRLAAQGTDIDTFVAVGGGHDGEFDGRRPSTSGLPCVRSSWCLPFTGVGGHSTAKQQALNIERNLTQLLRNMATIGASRGSSHSAWPLIRCQRS